eukprot:CAMPEP_0172315834 /NCGR_PEP_ID=MMETSP1058-20130122/26429_1 /TAXON_ID=83371 /ORGANISM="Detonula confervacea, Strain CCMP 353" /LENGTH=1230 /DNA_ID=CAMNT_0013030007 /DNA_START=67 /DNA_END=3759 /DNA_ORIENTATION=+
MTKKLHFPFKKGEKPLADQGEVTDRRLTPTPPPPTTTPQTRTPQTSNRTSASIPDDYTAPALPISPGVSNIDSIIEEEWLEPSQITNHSTTEDDSIMGMSTDGELVEDGGGKHVVYEDDNDDDDGDSWSKDDNDSYRREHDGSTVSDDDYYKQDYFMSEFSDFTEPEVITTMLSQDVLDMIDTENLSLSEMNLMSESDIPHDGDEEGGHDAAISNVNVENSFDLAAVPAKKDYRAHFDRMLSTPTELDASPDDDTLGLLPVVIAKETTDEGVSSTPTELDASVDDDTSGLLRVVIPMAKDTADEGESWAQFERILSTPTAELITSVDDDTSGLPVVTPKDATDEGESSVSGQTPQSVSKNNGETSNSDQDVPNADIASPPTPVRRSLKDEGNLNKLPGFPFPASSPDRSPEKGNSDSRNDDFAAALQRASTELKHQDPEIMAEDDMTAPTDNLHQSERIADVLKTPKSHNAMMSSINHLATLNSPLSTDDTFSLGASPTTSPDVVKRIVKENRKLRTRRKELLTLLSSTAQQFSSYEKVCSQKICKLEEQNRVLRDPTKNNNDIELAKSAASASSLLSEEIIDEKSPSTNDKSPSKKYDGEIVRRLSNGVLMQEKQLKSKDELITLLKLRCEVLKQSLLDRDGEILQEKNMWEEERSTLFKKLKSSTPLEHNHGELLTKKMEVNRLRNELETALGDITLLTTALETNNVALDAAVLQLDKLQEWKTKYGEAAAAIVKPPDILRTTDAEKLRSELKEKDNETSQLQKDLESSLNEIEELRESVTAAAEAKGYDDFHNVVEDLKSEAKASKCGADLARERIAQLESELESKKSEIDHLRSAAGGASSPLTKSSTDVDRANDSTADDGNTAAESHIVEDQLLPPSSHRGGNRLLNNLRLPFGAQRPSSDTNKVQNNFDFPTMVRQRDLKIKSLEAMIYSNSKILEKMKGDIERMDNEKEECGYIASQKIEELLEENKTCKMQVAGFEKAFMALNDQRTSESATLKPSQGDDEEIVDDNMFMWDEHDDGEANVEETEDVRATNLALQRMVTELQSSGSFQEDQIETLKAELVKLRVKSQQEKESALAQLSEENEIVTAQRSALENQLVEINKSAGVLRNSLSTATQSPAADAVVGSDPVLVAQVVMLENANKVLESSVDSLRSDMQEKLAPFLEQIALLEEEKRMTEEEMNTKLGCREMTISNLENSLQKYQQARFRVMKKKGKHHEQGSKDAD